MSLETVDKVKNSGKIYTPTPIVRLMLDYSGYVPGEYIKKKHVIDNSCGDGQILCEVVERYIQSCGVIDNVLEDLSTYIHGIELDEIEVELCKSNLNKVLRKYGFKNVDWDIRRGNSLTVNEFNGKMDFVIGNPPYVRMKNIKKYDGKNDNYQIIKNYKFSAKGMSDLYLAFYELGLRMLNSNGILCYIAPSTWINSSSGEPMRNHIWNERDLSGVIDFEHIQVFENAQTYVMIALFDKKTHNYIRYDKFSPDGNRFVPVSALTYDEVFIGGKMYFSSPEECQLIKAVAEPHTQKVEVKNGYATLADDIFIDNLPEFSEYTIPILKGSTGQWKKCLFPYDRNLKLIPLEKIKETSQDVYDYLMLNNEKLKSRTYDGKDNERSTMDVWHCIGRSQGLKDTFVDRIGLNSIVKCPDDLKIIPIKSGEGIYSGLYIKTDLPLKTIEDVLKTWDFIEYVKSLRKYKSGGYYTFSSNDVENYINYKLSI